MYDQDLNTIQGRITATACAIAEDFGHVYKGFIDGLHVFALPTAIGTFHTRCTSDDILDGTLTVLFMEDLSR